MTKVLHLLFLCLLCGCYTQRTAKRQVIKAQMEYPNVVAKGCAEWYPPKDSTVHSKEYLKGKDSIVYDTLKVDCNQASNQGKTVYIPYEKERIRVDTFRETVYKSVENTAQIATLSKAADNWKYLFLLVCGFGSGYIITGLIISFIKNK
jgi:hypothetical protein